MAAGKRSYDRRFDSGRPCLDLVATAAGTSGACELLDGAERLAEWLVAAGLVPSGTRLDAVDDTWVVRFRQLVASRACWPPNSAAAEPRAPWSGSTRSPRPRPRDCGPCAAGAARWYGH